MEMEFKDPARRRRLFLVMLGAVLAAGAGLGAFTLASKGAPQQAVETVPILVAARDIPARTTVGADDVAVHNIPVGEAMSQSYTAPTDVLGHVTSVPIYDDQQMTPNLFATNSANADFSILGPNDTVTADSPTWRAIAVKVPSERAVGGEIKAGDHVDLVVSVQIDILTQNTDGTYQKVDTANAQGFQGGTSTKITFQDLEVLKSTSDDDMYVLKVDLHQAEQIAHTVEEAPDALTLVLRPPEDTRPVDTSQYGTTNDRLIMTYLYPVPMLLDLSKLMGPSPYPYPGAPDGSGTNPGSSPIPGAGGSTASPEPSGSPAPDQSPAASPEASPTP